MPRKRMSAPQQTKALKHQKAIHMLSHGARLLSLTCVAVTAAVGAVYIAAAVMGGANNA